MDPEPEGGRLTSRKIAFGVFWGIFAAGAAFAFLGSCEDQQRDLDHLECLNDNVKSTRDGGYQRDCSVYE